MIYATLSPVEFKEYLRTAPTQIQEWHKELERKRQQSPSQDSPTNLLQQQADRLLSKIEDKVISNILFLRDLERIRQYIKERVKDEKKQGLIDEIVRLTNEITPDKIRNKSYTLKAEDQKELINKASKLKDDGTLLRMFSDLLSGTHSDGKRTPRFASICDILRKIATQWEEKGGGWSLIENASTFTLKIQGNKALEIPRDKKYIDKLDSACKKMLQRVNEVPFA